jgi:hypothetical protein
MGGSGRPIVATRTWSNEWRLGRTWPAQWADPHGGVVPSAGMERNCTFYFTLRGNLKAVPDLCRNCTITRNGARPWAKTLPLTLPRRSKRCCFSSYLTSRPPPLRVGARGETGPGVSPRASRHIQESDTRNSESERERERETETERERQRERSASPPVPAPCPHGTERGCTPFAVLYDVLRGPPP